ncbi:MAG TPA: TonB-dependent receptor [bacterium]|nr:TonB-dependent receptor [bacterium]
MARLLAFLLLIAFVGSGGPLYAAKKKFTPEGGVEEKQSEEKAAPADIKKGKEKAPKKKAEKKKEEPAQKPAAVAEPALAPIAKPAPTPANPTPAPKAEEKSAAAPTATTAPKVEEKPTIAPAVAPAPAPKVEEKSPTPVAKGDPVVLTGVVADADTKSPLVGAKVTTNTFPYPALTVKDGSFKYPMKLKPGIYKLEVVAPGYKPFQIDVEVVAGMKELPVKIWMALEASALRSLAEHPDGKPFETAGLRGAEKVLSAQQSVEKTMTAQKPIYVITGHLKDAKTSAPVSGAIVLKEQNLQIPVDAEGQFLLSLQPGEYTALIPIVGYIPEERKITVSGNGDVVWELTPVDRMVRMYGYNEKMAKSDASRLADLPGVAVLAPTRRYDSGLTIMGSPATENGYYIEGFQSPAAIHMLGRETVIHPALIQTAELSYGGFSPAYFDATGGVVSLTLRDPRTDRLGGLFDLSLFGVSVLAEGPITNADYFAATVSKGLTDLFPTFFYGEGSSLVYNNNYDVTILYLHKFPGNHRLRAYVFGGMDSIGVRAEHLRNAVPEHAGVLFPSQFFTRLTTDYTYSFKELDTEIDNRLALSYENRDWRYAMYAGSDFGLTAHLIEGLDEFHWRFDPHNKLTIGGDMRLGFFDVSTEYVSLPLEGEPFAIRVSQKIDSPGYQPYLHPTLYAMHELSYAGFTIQPGFLLALDAHSKKNTELSFDPRLMVQYRFDDSMALRLSGGLYSRRPDYELVSDRWGTEDLLAEHSAHVVLGFEKTFLNAYTVEVKGFYKHLYNLIRRSGVDLLEYNNLGEGYAAGGVLNFKADIADTFTGMVGYAFAISQRKDSAVLDYRSSDADIPHTFILTGRWTPAKEWALQGRFSLRSGAPHSRFSGSEFIDDGVESRFEPLPIVDANGRIVRNDARYDLVHELDLRGEYTFFLEEMTITLFAEMRGISGLFDGNAVGTIYNADFTEEIDLSTTPVVATVGLRGEF